jgi:hypothetical protein
MYSLHCNTALFNIVAFKEHLPKDFFKGLVTLLRINEVLGKVSDVICQFKRSENKA